MISKAKITSPYHKTFINTNTQYTTTLTLPDQLLDQRPKLSIQILLLVARDGIHPYGGGTPSRLFRIPEGRRWEERYLVHDHVVWTIVFSGCCLLLELVTLPRLLFCVILQ